MPVFSKSPVPIKQSNTSGPAAETVSLCTRCRLIDFPKTPLSWPRTNGVDIADLDYVFSPAECALCSLFSETIGKLRIPDVSSAEGAANIKLIASAAFATQDNGFQPEALILALRYDLQWKQANLRSFKYCYPLSQPGDSPADLQTAMARRRGTQTEKPTCAYRVPYTVDWVAILALLTECNTQHSECRQPLDRPLLSGLRVIDSQTRLLVACPDGAPYLTLSYIWGKGEHVPATGDCLPTCVPRVIQDSLTATTALGLRYIWIDRYCIPQDEPVERTRLLNLMGEIYHQSFLTIIAAAGDGPEYGLAGVRSADGPAGTSSTPSLSTGLDLGAIRLWECSVDHAVEVRGSKWNSRAWTFQEGLLAHRRLVFLPKAIYFQCPSDAWCGPPFHRSSADIFYASKASLSVQSIAFDYMLRNISYDEDSLDALRGVLAKAVTLNPTLVTVWGLPLEGGQDRSVDPMLSLAIALDWNLSVPPRADPFAFIRRGGSTPSWSWVGWKSENRKGRSASSPSHPSSFGSPGPSDSGAGKAQPGLWYRIQRERCSLTCEVMFHLAPESPQVWDGSARAWALIRKSEDMRTAPILIIRGYTFDVNWYEVSRDSELDFCVGHVPATGVEISATVNVLQQQDDGDMLHCRAVVVYTRHCYGDESTQELHALLLRRLPTPDELYERVGTAHDFRYIGDAGDSDRAEFIGSERSYDGEDVSSVVTNDPVKLEKLQEITEAKLEDIRIR